MQNPIYQMVRQVEFYCGQHPVDAKMLCAKLPGAIREKLALDVTVVETEFPDSDAAANTVAGALRIGLVISNQDEKARLIWENPIRISGGTLKFEGNWVKLPSNLKDSVAVQATAEELLLEVPR